VVIGARVTSQYLDAQVHAEGQLAEGEHAEGEHAEGEHAEGEHAEGEHAEGEQSLGSFADRGVKPSPATDRDALRRNSRSVAQSLRPAPS
jgi:hypothetical protein